MIVSNDFNLNSSPPKKPRKHCRSLNLCWFWEVSSPNFRYIWCLKSWLLNWRMLKFCSKRCHSSCSSLRQGSFCLSQGEFPSIRVYSSTFRALLWQICRAKERPNSASFIQCLVSTFRPTPRGPRPLTSTNLRSERKVEGLFLMNLRGERK